jgi:predicted O-linked N-acetylglucosamine transferase (SPINDLY family)
MDYQTHQLLTKATSNYQDGKLDEAEDILFGIIKYQPKNFDALHILGIVKGLRNQHREALDFFKKALRINPNNPYLSLNIAKAFSELGEIQNATKYSFNATKLNPEIPEVWFCYGKSLSTLNNLSESLNAYKKAIGLNPNFVEAWINQGCLLRRLGSYDQALASFEKAIEINVDIFEAWSNIGAVLNELNRGEQSLVAYDRAIRINPENAEVWYDRGILLHKLKQYDKALSSYDKAISINSKYAEAWSNIGVLLNELNRGEQSLIAYDKAIRINPENAEVWYNRGISLHKLKQYDKALSSYDKAISINSKYAEAWSNRGNVLFDLCKFEQGEESCREAIRIDQNVLTSHNSLLMNLNYLDYLNPLNALQEARHYGVKISEKSMPKFSRWNTNKSATTLRIGFVSGDLREHSVGYFIEGLFKHLDKDKFAIYAFPSVSTIDELTNRLLSSVVEWVPVNGKSDADTASLIHQKGIHVLIDLSGHTAGNRLTVFSYKPAPVQVSWLGLPMTTGIPEMDYVLGDTEALPKEFENQFTEAIWRLPECYLCLTPLGISVDVGILPAIHNGYITFASFNNLSKINDRVVEVWSLILKTLPNSKLLLKAKQLTDPNVCSQTRGRFAVYGIASDRLLFKTLLDTRAEHLALYNEVDIALDTFPYPGVTTSAEAYLMGIPVLALKGNSFLSGTATSLANNAGLNDWVASDVDDYVNKAVQFASDPHRLAQLRSTLRDRVIKSPLFDSPRFAKNFGDALRGMWDQRSESKASLIEE